MHDGAHCSSVGSRSTTRQVVQTPYVTKCVEYYKTITEDGRIKNTHDAVAELHHQIIFVRPSLISTGLWWISSTRSLFVAHVATHDLFEIGSCLGPYEYKDLFFGNQHKRIRPLARHEPDDPPGSHSSIRKSTALFFASRQSRHSPLVFPKTTQTGGRLSRCPPVC